MKFLFFFLITFLLPLIFYGQVFEGEIIYKNTFKSKVASATDAQIAAIFGDTAYYYIQDGNYKNVVNGGYVKWQLYSHANNKLYYKLANTEALTWIDGNVYKDSLVSVSRRPGAAQILGYTCDEITLICTSSVQQYYFNTGIKADSRVFEKHRYGSWYDFVSRTHALPLKIVIESKEFIMESTAVSLSPGHLDQAIFQVPDVPMTASPENNP